MRDGWKSSAGLLATLGILALAQPAFACEVVIPDAWELRQDNNYVLSLTTTKIGADKSYKAEVTLNTGLKGLASGKYGASGLYFDVFWDDGKTGYYELDFAADGVLAGKTCDRKTAACTGVRTLTDFDLKGCD